MDQRPMDQASSDGLDEPTPNLKRLRKGTMSCIECRHRKVRCVWANPGDAVCVGCKARGRPCAPQIYRRRSVNQHRLSSWDRIHRLEQQLATITAAVRDPNRPSDAVSSTSPEHARLQSEEASTPEEDPDTEFGHVHGIASTPPTHLRALFGNSLIASSHHDEDGQSHLSQARVSKRYLDQARSRFQRLMPPREDVLAVATYAAPWMSLYTQLFPASTSIGTRDQLISHYEHASAPEAHPVFMANFLLSFAVTALQAEGAVRLAVGKDAITFAGELCHVFNATVATHTGLATTLEGLEAIVMYLRLLLAIGSVRTLWLTLRRAIALAELMGLPRTARLSNSEYEHDLMSPQADATHPQKSSTQRIAIWEAISATDRLSSMMFNLPAASLSYALPEKKITSPEGEVMPRPYMFVLSGLAAKVQELDESCSLPGQLAEETYQKVLATDSELRALKSQTPLVWWNQATERLSAEILVQFWHYYLTARVHLNSAMNLKDEHDQYAYSRITCTNACEEVFTAATFLLLSSLKQGLQPDQRRQEMVQGVLSQMDAVRDPTGAAFVRDAAAAIRSLDSLLQTGQKGNGSQNLTVRIPFLGKVRIGRQEPRETTTVDPQIQPLPAQSQPQHDAGIPIGAEYNQQPPLDPSFEHMMPWLMELDTGIPALNDTFYFDDFPELDQWTMNHSSTGSVIG